MVCDNDVNNLIEKWKDFKNIIQEGQSNEFPYDNFISILRDTCDIMFCGDWFYVKSQISETSKDELEECLDIIISTFNNKWEYCSKVIIYLKSIVKLKDWPQEVKNIYTKKESDVTLEDGHIILNDEGPILLEARIKNLCLAKVKLNNFLKALYLVGKNIYGQQEIEGNDSNCLYQKDNPYFYSLDFFNRIREMYIFSLHRYKSEEEFSKIICPLITAKVGRRLLDLSNEAKEKRIAPAWKEWSKEIRRRKTVIEMIKICFNKLLKDRHDINQIDIIFLKEVFKVRIIMDEEDYPKEKYKIVRELLVDISSIRNLNIFYALGEVIFERIKNEILEESEKATARAFFMEVYLRAMNEETNRLDALRHSNSNVDLDKHKKELASRFRFLANYFEEFSNTCCWQIYLTTFSLDPSEELYNYLFNSKFSNSVSDNSISANSSFIDSDLQELDLPAALKADLQSIILNGRLHKLICVNMEELKTLCQKHLKTRGSEIKGRKEDLEYLNRENINYENFKDIPRKEVDPDDDGYEKGFGPEPEEEEEEEEPEPVTGKRKRGRPRLTDRPPLKKICQIKNGKRLDKNMTNKRNSNKYLQNIVKNKVLQKRNLNGKIIYTRCGKVKPKKKKVCKRVSRKMLFRKLFFAKLAQMRRRRIFSDPSYVRPKVIYPMIIIPDLPVHDKFSDKFTQEIKEKSELKFDKGLLVTFKKKLVTDKSIIPGFCASLFEENFFNRTISDLTTYRKCYANRYKRPPISPVLLDLVADDDKIGESGLKNNYKENNNNISTDNLIDITENIPVIDIEDLTTEDEDDSPTSMEVNYEEDNDSLLADMDIDKENEEDPYNELNMQNNKSLATDMDLDKENQTIEEQRNDLNLQYNCSFRDEIDINVDKEIEEVPKKQNYELNMQDNKSLADILVKENVTVEEQQNVLDLQFNCSFNSELDMVIDKDSKKQNYESNIQDNDINDSLIANKDKDKENDKMQQNELYLLDSSLGAGMDIDKKIDEEEQKLPNELNLPINNSLIVSADVELEKENNEKEPNGPNELDIQEGDNSLDSNDYPPSPAYSIDSQVSISDSENNSFVLKNTKLSISPSTTASLVQTPHMKPQTNGINKLPKLPNGNQELKLGTVELDDLNDVANNLQHNGHTKQLSEKVGRDLFDDLKDFELM